jgi:hypothetical protein
MGELAKGSGPKGVNHQGSKNVKTPKGKGPTVKGPK